MRLRFAWFVASLLSPVLSGYAAAPQITLQPKSQAAVMGYGVEFSVEATGTPPLRYEWRKDGVLVPDPFILLPSYEGSPKLSVFAGFDQLGTYTVKVSNTEGSVVSDGAVLSFALAGRATSPAYVTLALGASTQLTFEGIGNGLRYQWLKNGVTLPFATSPALSIGPAQEGDADRYTAVVSNAYGAVAVASYQVTIARSPWFATQPLSQAIDVGRNVTLQATVLGSGPISYQWTKDGALLPGAVGPALTLQRVQPADGGRYQLNARNAAGSADSTVAALTVVIPVALPTMTRQPSSQHLTVGAQPTLEAAATAAAMPLSTRWYREGNQVFGWGSGIRASEGGRYYFAAWDNNGVGPVLSTPATVTLANDAFYTFTTVAGFSRSFGNVDGPVAIATFSQPMGFALGTDGTLYVADTGNRTIRKISPSGQVSLLAGGGFGAAPGDGTGATARFWYPMSVAVGSDGAVYVGDIGTVRKISPAGVVTTLAGTAEVLGAVDAAGAAARFDGPNGLAVDANGNVYVAEARNATLRKITPAGVVSTLAGQAGSSGFVDGAGSAARFNGPNGLALDAAGNLVVADAGNNAIRRVTPTGQVSTVAGTGVYGRVDGPVATAQFTAPAAVAADKAGNLFVAESQTIRRISSAGLVATIAGKTIVEGGRVISDGIDGTGEDAKFVGLAGVVVNGAGEVFVLETSNSDVRKGIAPDGGDIPLITTHPVGQVVASGATATLVVAATSATPMTYQWQRGGRYLAGETNATLTRAAVVAGDAGTYSVLVQNRSGTAVSNAVSLEVTAPVEIQSQPARLSVGGGATLSVVTGKPVPLPSPRDPPAPASIVSYQWTRDDVAIAGATNATVAASGPGRYRVWVGNSAGAVLSDEALVTGSATPSRLINLSVRTRAGAGATALTLGFVAAPVGNATTIPLLVRGVGPALAAYGVPAVLGDPLLQLYRGQEIVFANDNWGEHAADNAATATQVGAFTLPDARSLDAALSVAALPAGAYTAQVTPATGAAGTALAELYDAAPRTAADGAYARLINVSARAQLSPDNSLIAGLAVTGSTPKRLLIRAVGQSLQGFGVTDAVARVQLSVYAGSQLVAVNDDWRTNGGGLQTLAAPSGAFPLDAGSQDAALVVNLAPGSYTAVVSTPDGATGTALVEVYDLDR